MRAVFLFALLFLPTLACNGQKAPARKYLFSEVWVWEYTGADGTKGEMAIYREPKLNYWLLTAEAYGNTDDMCDWILLQPNGTCYLAYKDAELDGGGTLLKMKQAVPKVQSMPAYWKATGKSQYFGDKNSGFPLIKGKEYRVAYAKTSEKSTFYIAGTRADFGPLNIFNDLDTDARLPVRFPKDIPAHTITLSEETIASNYRVSYRFKYISHTEYHINLSEYELRN